MIIYLTISGSEGSSARLIGGLSGYQKGCGKGV